MGTAEHDDIGAVGDGLGESGTNGLVCGRRVDFAAFDEFGEVVADDTVDGSARAELVDDAGVEVAVEGARRGEDGDASAAGGARRGLHGGHHADEGQVEEMAEIGDGCGGSGVAGDDDELGVGLDEAMGDGKGALAHFTRVAGAVGEIRGIGEVNGAFAGSEAAEFAENAEPADAGIEHADGSRVHPVKHTASMNLPPPTEGALERSSGHAAPMTKRLEVALLPSEAEAIEADAFLVIDVLRATTTIATLFEGGLADLLVADDIEAARERARSEGRVLFGEVGGLPPEGFDYGNSPAEAVTLDVRGKGAVLFTTNGTRAICGSAGRGAVATGAFSNAGAAARWAAGFDRVALVCAGNSGGKRFALEDFAAAARLVQLISRESPGLELGDAAGVAAGLTGYEDWIAPGLPQQTDRSARLVAGAHHAQGLKALGLGADIAFAAREDTSAEVPQVAEHGEGWALLRNER